MATSKDESTSAQETEQSTDEKQDIIQPHHDSTLVLPPFVRSRHTSYIQTLAIELSQPTSYEGAVTEHLRMSGIYWSLTALHILLPDAAAVDALMGVTTATTSSNTMPLMDWVWTCYHETEGSFGGNTGHPGHILYTLSALQILAISGRLSDMDQKDRRNRMIAWITSLQQIDGSFVGDTSSGAGEVDTRFTYCALQCLALLGAPLATTIRLNDAVHFLLSCRNPADGGFGSCQGAESHAGQVFCCVGALAMAGAVDRIASDSSRDDTLAWWLSERQVDSGGLNGRPEKQADVCYSWWILSSLSIIGKLPWIQSDHLARYILQCQDAEDGGIADRPEDMADAFHTFFGIAGLSLLGYLPANCRPIDPVYALPTDVVRALQLPGQVICQGDGTVAERLEGYDVVRPKQAS